MSKDKLRSLTLGQDCEFTKEFIKYRDEEYEIRQPSVLIRNEIIMKSQSDGKTSPLMFLIWSIIFCTYVPNTDERIFDGSDYDVLVSNPTGGFVDLFGAKATDLINVDINVKKKP